MELRDDGLYLQRDLKMYQVFDSHHSSYTFLNSLFNPKKKWPELCIQVKYKCETWILKPVQVVTVHIAY